MTDQKMLSRRYDWPYIFAEFLGGMTLRRVKAGMFRRYDAPPMSAVGRGVTE